MSGFLEEIVRSAQTQDVSPPRTAPTSGGSSSGGPVSATIGGTASAGALITFTFSSTAIPGSPVIAQYILGGADDLQDATLGIIAAINAQASLLAVGIYAVGVSGSPLEFTINQPSSLSPQATISGISSLDLTVGVTSGNVSISPGRGRVAMKTLQGSRNASVSTYNKKYPKEMTFADTLRANLTDI